MIDEEPKSPGYIKKRIKNNIRILKDVLGGINGKKFYWCGGEQHAYRPRLKKLGITLETKTQIKKHNWRLKRGVEPVGEVYFGSPISKDAEVYLVECQAVPDETLEESHSD